MMGFAFVISLGMSITIDYFGILDINLPDDTDIDDLHMANKGAKGLHWLEFFSYATPGLTIILAYSADDMFEKFNKFPE